MSFPFQNKARLVEQIADLVRHKKIDGIRELRDESDRQGMRIVEVPQARRGPRDRPQPSLQARRSRARLA